jgi:hypothetical protein
MKRSGVLSRGPSRGTGLHSGLTWAGFLLLIAIVGANLSGTILPQRNARQATAPALPRPGAKAATAGTRFVDVAKRAGLGNAVIVGGGVTSKKYLLEEMGGGAAFFDFDNDDWPDIFLVNGTTVEGFPEGQAPTNYLFKNNRDGTFTDVTERSGLGRSGWGQGVCIGDYDNDGLISTSRIGATTFSIATRARAASATSRGAPACLRPKAGGPRAAHFSITTATAIWTCSSPTTSPLISPRLPCPATTISAPS